MRHTILAFFILFIATVTMAHADEGQHPSGHVIILLGAPGSGKGTQATQITKKLGIPHISTGDLFRENISKNTPLGRQAKEYMNAGKLVPDQLVLDMLSDRIAKPDCAEGYLLDGFPRTIPQAEAFDKILDKNFKFTVISLEVSDEVIMKRIEGRRQQSGEERPDDKAEVVKERLKVFHDQTEPLIQYYDKRHQLIKIDGEQSPDKVFDQIMKVVS